MILLIEGFFIVVVTSLCPHASLYFAGKTGLYMFPLPEKMMRIINLFKSFAVFSLKKSSRFIPDRIYLEWLYRILLGRRLELEHPVYFTEKLQWLKLYYHRPECTEMVDKFAVKHWVAQLIGPEYVIPTLGVWERAEDIDFDALPDSFVLKCTHDCGGLVICRDKSALDIPSTQKKLNRCLRRDIYWRTREWPYLNVPHRIIAEQYMEDESGGLRDYKFLCFDGVPKIMFVVVDRYTNKAFDAYYDMDFKPVPIESKFGDRSNRVELEKPDSFDEMKRLAAILSAGFPHVRVDFYSVGSRVYFGEMTFFDSSGFDDLNSWEWNRTFGDWLRLPSPYVVK